MTTSRRLTAFLREIRLERDRVTDWNKYPFSIPAIQHLETLELSPGATIFVGENGSGKSTLIEAIAVRAGFNPEGGSKNFSTRLRPSESELDRYLTLVRGTRREKSGFFLRAETMFNVSTEAEEYRAYGWENLHEKSHGEAFLWVAMNRFSAGGLYILDEPEAALSPQRQLVFLARMHQLILAGSQFVVSTHSPILMGYPRAKLVQLDPGGIREVVFEETDHYLVTKAFLMNPEKMLRSLIDQVGSDE